MNKTPWTPGPWILTPCGDILGNRNTRTDNGLVAAMCSDRKDAEGAANARLIAAAPEMAEVLEQFVRPSAAEDGIISLGELVSRAHAFFGHAHAILARIRGDAP